MLHSRWYLEILISIELIVHVEFNLIEYSPLVILYGVIYSAWS